MQGIGGRIKDVLVIVARAREEKETIGSEKPERDVIVFRARFYHPHTSTF
jgi:hypothetical protein